VNLKQTGTPQIHAEVCGVSSQKTLPFFLQKKLQIIEVQSTFAACYLK
jgi:hypothetical protein